MSAVLTPYAWAHLIEFTPDFPKPGVQFADLSPIFERTEAFCDTVNTMRERAEACTPNAVLGIESRGFILGSALAYAWQKTFTIARKAGKLPPPTLQASYGLEYGSATLEVHGQRFAANDRVLLVDDVLATGGTLEAAAHLVRQAGAEVAGAICLVEIPFLKGRQRLEAQGFPVYALHTL